MSGTEITAPQISLLAIFHNNAAHVLKFIRTFVILLGRKRNFYGIIDPQELVAQYHLDGLGHHKFMLHSWHFATFKKAKMGSWHAFALLMGIVPELKLGANAINMECFPHLTVVD
jgi:hypothetical protein